MAIIDKTLKSVENYIKNNEKTDDFYKEKALEILRKFGRLEIAGNVSMQAVVGFGEEGAPVFWDMEAGNLSASAPTGIAVNHFGCATVLLILVLRFPEIAFGYYLFTDEYAPAYFGRDAHCAGSASLCFEKPETHLNLLEKLFSELKYRQTLTGEERGKLPFLLVVFGNYGARCPETEKERFCDLFELLFRQGKNLRAACMLTTTRPETEFLYDRYKDTFICRLASDGARKGHEPVFLWQKDGACTQVMTYHLSLGIGLR